MPYFESGEGGGGALPLEGSYPLPKYCSICSWLTAPQMSLAAPYIIEGMNTDQLYGSGPIDSTWRHGHFLSSTCDMGPK